MYRGLINPLYNNNLRMHPCISRLSFPFLNCFCFKIWSFYFVVVKIASGREGGAVGAEVLYKVLYGEAPPRGPTPDSFLYHFDRKGTPFVYF